jgi:hypothetical protein
VSDVIDEGRAIKVLVNEYLPGRFCPWTGAGTTQCDVIEITRTDKRIVFQVKQNYLDCR